MVEEPSSARICSMLDVINARAGSRSERSSSAIGSVPSLSLAPSSRVRAWPSRFHAETRRIPSRSE
jgi:hypothetical protein